MIGNDPYYRVLSDMARSKGWSVQKSFNSDYDNLLPLAKGHILLIESHRDVPVISIDTLEKFYPKASEGLNSARGTIEIDGTTIMFVDLAKMLNNIDAGGSLKDN